MACKSKRVIVAAAILIGVALASASSPAVAAQTPGTPLTTVHVGHDPQDIALSVDGKFAYVTTLEGKSVDVIDLAALSVSQTIALGTPTNAIKAFSDGSSLLVTEASRGAVVELDPRSGEVTDTLHVGGKPIALAVVPKTHEFVVDNGSSSVTIVNVDSGDQRVVQVGATPWGVVVSPDGARAFVAVQSTNSVVAIDLASGSVMQRFRVGQRPAYLAIAPDGETLYVADAASSAVFVVDVTSGTVTHRIHVGGEPWGITVSPDGKFVYVTDVARARAITIDTASASVITNAKTGAGPEFVATSNQGTLVLVANSLANSVSVLRGATAVSPSAGSATTSPSSSSEGTPAASTNSRGTGGSATEVLPFIIGGIALLALITVALVMVGRRRSTAATTARPATEPAVCSSCGDSLGDAKFCGKCGTPSPRFAPALAD